MTTQPIRLSIERMSYGADAIAHADDGKTVFVRGGVPGDVVEAQVIKDQSRFSLAETVKVLESSPARVQPACPYASMCGGCPWASISREAQLEHKRANVVDSLVRVGHMDADVAQELVAPCEAPSEAWGYRNKVELAFARINKRAVVGMHTQAPATGEAPGVIKVDACPLLDSRYKKLVKAVSGALGYLAGSNPIDIDRVGIRASSRTKDVEVALWTSPGSFPRAKAAKVLKDATKATSVVRVLCKGEKKARKVSSVEVLGGRGFWRERLGTNTMMFSAPSFFQVNTKGAQRLVGLVMEGLAPTPDDDAMDLYCGAGTFTLSLAEQAGWVSAVESYGPAVRDLRRNLDAAALGNVEPIGGDAGREFPDLDANIIVVDPPRAGLSADVVEKLSAQPARRIAYVSCDPATLARDLKRFADKGVYRPVSITPVDLFPQTYHVETVTILAR